MRGKFTEQRIFPRLVVIEFFATEHTNLMRSSQRTAFFERRHFGLVPFGMGVRHHQNKIRLFESGKAHGVRNRTCGTNAQILFPFSNILQKNCRCETGILSKLTPSKSGVALAFIVVILDELAIICIFKNRLHDYKYSF